MNPTDEQLEKRADELARAAFPIDASTEAFSEEVAVKAAEKMGLIAGGYANATLTALKVDRESLKCLQMCVSAGISDPYIEEHITTLKKRLGI